MQIGMQTVFLSRGKIPLREDIYDGKIADGIACSGATGVFWLKCSVVILPVWSQDDRRD